MTFRADDAGPDYPDLQCVVCGREAGVCECPECPVCGMAGRPECSTTCVSRPAPSRPHDVEDIRKLAAAVYRNRTDATTWGVLADTMEEYGFPTQAALTRVWAEARLACSAAADWAVPDDYDARERGNDSTRAYEEIRDLPDDRGIRTLFGVALVRSYVAHSGLDPGLQLSQWIENLLVTLELFAVGATWAAAADDSADDLADLQYAEADLTPAARTRLPLLINVRCAVIAAAERMRAPESSAWEVVSRLSIPGSAWGLTAGVFLAAARIARRMPRIQT